MKGGKRMLGGFVSSERTDLQGEEVIQKGLLVDELLSNGWFNDDHSQKIGDRLAVPRVAELRPNPKVGYDCLYVEGEVLPTPAGIAAWDLAKALNENPELGRKVGFSVEGDIHHRVGGKIHRAMLRNIAVTTRPVNEDAECVAIAKSLTSLFASEDEITKAMAAGYETDSAAQKGCDALRRESLGGVKDQKNAKGKKSETDDDDEDDEKVITLGKCLDFVRSERPLYDPNLAFLVAKRMHIRLQGVR